MSKPKYDVVVWGATGFTGRLCAKYLSESTRVKLAIGGRSKDKLEKLKAEIGITSDIIVADLRDAGSLDNLCKQTKVILTTAGPYSTLGEPIVEACIRNKVSCVDLTGEATWIRKMIDRHHEKAETQKVKIVNSCGFDCIPSDIGTLLLSNKMLAESVEPIEIQVVVGPSLGGFSGGTFASVIEVLSSSISDLMEVSCPFCLCPRDNQSGRPVRPADTQVLSANRGVIVGFDKIYKSWTMPYIMESINRRIVNRSNALLKYKYGPNLIYNEYLGVPSSGINRFLGAISASFGALCLGMLLGALKTPILRSFLQYFAPKSGEGPSEEQRNAGFYSYYVWGKGRSKTGEEKLYYMGMVGKGDPGYRSTSMMISEAAILLAEDKSLPTLYGIITPAAAFGTTILPKLEKIGLTYFFETEAEDVKNKVKETLLAFKKKE